MTFDQDKLVLLFYKDFEHDSYFKNDRYLKRLIRPIYHKFSRRQKVSGFFVWYQLLIKALRQEGCDVRLNDYAMAKRHPEHPVGLVGYPRLLDNWQLNNPAILGPSLFDHPRQAPRLLSEDRYKYYVVTCQWMKDIFDPYYGTQCVLWHAGIDDEEWRDTRSDEKSIDVLVYDKVRWNRDRYEPELIEPLLRHLAHRGLSFEVVRYGQYDHSSYKASLGRARSMIFLCEHETQGMAYQEALASNVPVLAWDQGLWLDPGRSRYTDEPVATTSVPYFSAECGRRFVGMKEFECVFHEFWTNLGMYEPRRFAQRELSFSGSAKIYLQYYSSLTKQSS